MTEVVKVEIPVTPETAAALSDPRRAAAIGRMVDRILRPAEGGDDLIAAFDASRAAARAAGLSDEKIDAELAARRAERRR